MLIFFVWNLIFSNEAQDTGGFKFAFAGWSGVAGVDLAISNLSSYFEHLPEVFFTQSLKIIFLHLTVIKLEVEVDVEGSD